MSERGRISIINLLHRIIRENATNVMRQRLKGSIKERTAACERAVNLMALVKTGGNGRQWEGRGDADIISEAQRQAAADNRLSASARIKAIERLCALEGYLPLTELGAEPVDDWIRRVVNPAKPETKVETTKPVNGALPSQSVADLEHEFSQVGRG